MIYTVKKYVNFRLPVIIACALAIGTTAGLLFGYYKTDLIWLTAFIPVAAVPIIIATAVFKNFKPLAFIILALIFLYAGALNGILRLDAYGKNNIDVSENKTYSISGTVKEKSAFSSGEYIIVTDVSANGTKLKYDIIVYLGNSYGDFCDNGYKVKFISSLTAFDAFSYGKLNYNAENNIKYRCTVNGGLKSGYRFSLFGEIRSCIRKTLFNNIEYETAAVCYGMLVGETAFIDDNALANFRYGGIAHIFAVSGLHIGIIFGILSFLCKKLRVNKYAGAVLCIFSVFFYAGICGFTVSSVRSAIMCAIAVFSKLIYAKNDGMNSLSAAVIILLLINPFSLFSVGFQLSVCAVGGIFIFSNPITRLLSRIRIPPALLNKTQKTSIKRFLQNINIPKKLASAFTVSLSAQAGTLPVMLASFGYISGAGLLLNVIIVPVLSALFSVIFIFTLLCSAIAPIAPFLLPLATTPLDAVLSFLVGAGFEKSLISGFGAGLFIPLYYLTVLLISDKLNLRLITRIIAVGCSAVLLVSYVLTSAFLPFKGYKIYISAYYGGGDVIIKSSQGTVLIVTDYINSSYISADLNKYYSANLDGIIMLGTSGDILQFYNFETNAKDIYVYSENDYIQPFDKMTVNYETAFTLCGADFEFKDSYTLSVNCGGVNMCVCASDKTTVEKCDLLVSLYEQPSCVCDYKVYFNLSGYKYNVYDNGDLVFTVKDGKVNKR